MDLLVRILHLCLCVSMFVQDVFTVECRSFSEEDTSDLINVKIRSCHPSEIDDGINVTVTCPKKYVVADLEVISGIHNDKCTGKTLDQIASVHDCYWKQTCSLALPKTKMITCETEEDMCRCFMQNPDFLVVTRAKCVKKKFIKDFICPGDKKGKPLKKAGLLRSHKNFPWFYPGSNTTIECTQLMRRRKNLVLDWRVNDICEIDGLAVQTVKVKTDIFDSNQAVITKANTGKKKADKEVEITFERSQKDGVESGCGGFLMCYKDIKTGVDDYMDQRKWACDDVIDKTASIKISTSNVTYTKTCPSDVANADCCPRSCE